VASDDVSNVNEALEAAMVMACALVEIDKQVDHARACGEYLQGISPSVFFDRIASILDGGTTAKEQPS
jgi:hypothetical protein